MLNMLLESGHRVIVLARRASALPSHAKLKAINIDLADTTAVKVIAKDIAEHSRRAR